eukprot:m.263282 g.263282  ORF g.263282 m.263282 type:complete len:160 (+) comp54639_c0_seq1:64-543(+)
MSAEMFAQQDSGPISNQAADPSNPPDSNTADYAHPEFATSKLSLMSTLHEVWGVFEAHGFKILLVVLVLYILWVKYGDALRQFRQQQIKRFEKHIAVDPSVVQQARDKQQQVYLDRMAQQKAEAERARAAAREAAAAQQPAENFARRRVASEVWGSSSA